MQEKKDRQEDEDPTGPERRSTPLQPSSRHTPPPGEPETISLLDLMGDQPAETERLPGAPLTVELPPLVVSDPATPRPSSAPPDADQATPTANVRPSQTPPTQGRTERPLAQGQWNAPESTPTVDDTEATRVQPRVAFPGATQQQPRPRTDDRRPPTADRPAPTGDEQTRVRPRPQQPPIAPPPPQPRQQTHRRHNSRHTSNNRRDSRPRPAPRRPRPSSRPPNGP
jgi:hypothetical protein